jgi:hypothetical protein
MIDIPPFETPTDEDLYVNMFDDKLTAYTTLMDKVKDALYGPGFGNYANMPGSCLDVVERITSDLINLTSHEYTLTKKATLKDYTLGDK